MKTDLKVVLKAVPGVYHFDFIIYKVFDRAEKYLSVSYKTGPQPVSGSV